jgi:acyl-CoA synthetase (NDP forming)
VARYDRLPATASAEVAFVVSDEHQGRGLGTLLLEHLAAAARERGITRFFADTLPDNRRMIGVFRDAGWVTSAKLEDGVVRIEFAIEPTASATAAQHAREQRADARSVARLLEPTSVVVIGAGRTAGTVGNELLRNLVAGGFTGPVHAVHPEADEVAGVPACASVEEVPGEVDLAVIVVPMREVHDVVAACARKRVRGLVIVSAGFSESGHDGAVAEREVVALANRHGMRVIGPNSMGVVNTDPAVRLEAVIGGAPVLEGRVGFLSQSGALGIAILEWASRLGLGVSSFVSVGNKADVSGNDLLQFWEGDERTDAILLYLESFGNPRKFTRVARRVARAKPIVAVKSRRPSLGDERAVDALFDQTGVLRVDTLEQLFDTGLVLARSPLPGGRRVAVVAASGGPGLLAADACEAAGLQVLGLGDATRTVLRGLLPDGCVVANPVQLVASASLEDYAAALRTVLAAPEVDAVLVILTPPVRDRAQELAAVAEEASGAGKPVLANLLTADGDLVQVGRMPTFRSPEAAAFALARAATYAEWRARPAGRLPDLAGVDVVAARLLVDAALAEEPGGSWLPVDDATALMSDVGISVPATDVALTADEAAAEAARIGYPVVLRPAGAAAPVHRERVQRDLEDEAAVRHAFSALEATEPDGEELAVAVQPVVAGGVELVVEVRPDPSFGNLVRLAVGGPSAALIADEANRTTPLTDVDARDLVRSLRSAPVLFDGALERPLDVPALEDLLLRVGRLVEELPEVVELLLDPVVLTADGAVVAGAWVRLAPVRPGPELAVRRLR